MRFPENRHGLIRRADALAAGWTHADLTAALRRAELVRVCPGHYARAERVGQYAADAALYRLRCLAVATDEEERVFSHASAAAIHGLGTLNPDRARIHITENRSSGGRRRALRQLHCSPLRDDEIVSVDGIRVTSLARTAVDVAGGGSFAQALAVFDAALALGVTREALAETLGARRRRGIATARTALAFADGASANPGESWARAQMIQAGLPLPGLQVRYRVSTGDAIVDFDWAHRLAGEFDGKVKYLCHRRDGESIEDAVLREKRREDDLRRQGLMVVRWTWADLEQRAVVDLLVPWLRRYGLMPS